MPFSTPCAQSYLLTLLCQWLHEAVRICGFSLGPAGGRSNALLLGRQATFQKLFTIQGQRAALGEAPALCHLRGLVLERNWLQGFYSFMRTGSRVTSKQRVTPTKTILWEFRPPACELRGGLPPREETRAIVADCWFRRLLDVAANRRATVRHFSGAILCMHCCGDAFGRNVGE